MFKIIIELRFPRANHNTNAYFEGEKWCNDKVLASHGIDLNQTKRKMLAQRSDS